MPGIRREIGVVVAVKMTLAEKDGGYDDAGDSASSSPEDERDREYGVVGTTPRNLESIG